MAKETAQFKRVELPAQAELLPKGIVVRELDPKNTRDFEIARDLDLRTTDAINPDSTDPEDAHKPMTPAGIRRWMTERKTNRLRVVEQDGKPIGFVYMYNDSRKDEDFRRRANEVRRMQGASANESVWEVNFYFDEGTEYPIVQGAVGETLREFAQTHGRERTIVYFADDGDMREAHEEATGLPRDELVRWSQKRVATAADTYEDTQVLQEYNFRYGGPMQYTAGSGNPKDRIFVARIGAGSLQTT